jgi:hypothetical protein
MDDPLVLRLVCGPALPNGSQGERRAAFSMTRQELARLLEKRRDYFGDDP